MVSCAARHAQKSQATTALPKLAPEIVILPKGRADSKAGVWPGLNRQEEATGGTPAGENMGTPFQIILGLFLIHLAATVGAFVFIESLVRWLNGASMTEAALMFGAAFGAVATILVLLAHRRGGVIIAVAIVVFWSFVMFGASGPTAIHIAALAVAALVVAAVLVLAESSIRRRWAARKSM